MRRFACLLVLTIVRTVHATPAIEDAIRDAAAAGKPLIVDFGAAWCAPCQRFDRDVLASADVQRALATVAFVRYDVDVPPGDAAARRYNVESMPTFLVLASDGSELRRVQGVPGGAAQARSWFLGFLDHARAHVASTAELEAAVAQHPDNAAARMRLAHHDRAVGRTTDAIAQLDAIVALPTVDRSLAAAAFAEKQAIALAEQRLQLTIDAAHAFVTQFPGTPDASSRLALLAVSGRVPSPALADLARQHLAAVAPVDLPEAVRAAIVAGAIADAERAVAPATPERQLLYAEIELAQGRTDAARTRIAAVCRTPTDLELWCLQLDRALHVRMPASPLVQRMRRAANDVMLALERPGEERGSITDLASLAERDRAFGNAVVRALAAAVRACADIPTRPERVSLFIGRGHARAIGNNTDLVACLEIQLRSAALPPPTHEVEVYESVGVDPLPPAQRHARRDEDPLLHPRRPLERGMLAFGAGRTGPVDSASIGGRGRAELVAIGECRLVATAELEIGSASSTSARGFGGLACKPSARSTVDLNLGFGTSNYGDALPRAHEVPLEARVRFDLGRVTGHAWLDATRILGTSARAHERDGDLITPDEWIVGGGVTVPTGAVKLFVGAQLERRIAGTGGALMVGLPLHDFD